MITVNENLIVTRQVNEIMCRYAKKVLIKNFLLEFSFHKEVINFNELITDDINPLLVKLNFNQGDINNDEYTDVNEYVLNYIKQLDESDLVALYFFTINKKFFSYLNDFEKNEGFEIKDDGEKFDIQLGRELAYRIYEPQTTNLDQDLADLLRSTISTFSNEIDLSEIDEYSVEYILETINNLFD